MGKIKLTQDGLRQVLDYDQETGFFTWKKQKATWIKKGKKAGSKTHHGYISIMIDGVNYLAHRLAFLWMEGYFPENDIDHIDRDKANNKWENLREISRSCNNINSGLRANCTSGVKGVAWDKVNKKWLSHITIAKKYKNLGRYKTLKEAAEARWAAEAKYGFVTCNAESNGILFLGKEAG